MNKEDDEVLWISTRMDGKTYLLAAIYRPEYSDMVDGQTTRLEEHLLSAFQISSNIIVIGDLNVDLFQPQRTDAIELKEKVNNIFSNFGMKQRLQGSRHPRKR